MEISTGGERRNIAQSQRPLTTPKQKLDYGQLCASESHAFASQWASWHQTNNEHQAPYGCVHMHLDYYAPLAMEGWKVCSLLVAVSVFAKLFAKFGLRMSSN